MSDNQNSEDKASLRPMAMTTWTQVAYEYDRLVKLEHAVKDVPDFRDEVMRTHRAAEKSGGMRNSYLLDIPADRTRSGRDETLTIEIYQGIGGGLHDDGNPRSARQLAGAIYCAGTESTGKVHRNLRAYPAYEVILGSCGFASEAELDNSAFKIVGLVVRGPTSRLSIVDYQVVMKNETAYSFNVADPDHLQWMMMAGHLPKEDQTLVFEHAVHDNNDIQAITAHAERAQWHGDALIVKQSRQREPKAQEAMVR